MPVAQLKIESGPNAGQELAVLQSAVVGRSRTADLTLADETVSREHAALRVEGITIVVEDVGSSNGTWVNDRRIEQATRVDDGDTIQLGHTRLRIRIASGEGELATPADSTVIHPAPLAGAPD